MTKLQAALKDPEEEQEVEVSQAVAEEIGVDDAVAADLSTNSGAFSQSKKNKNVAKGFSCLTTCYCFTPDCLWQDFS